MLPQHSPTFLDSRPINKLCTLKYQVGSCECEAFLKCDLSALMRESFDNETISQRFDLYHFTNTGLTFSAALFLEATSAEAK